ncbi:MAG: hypothetical protein Ct9H300mP12_12860 [Acidimicrobiales bacterium]|nr:MAG: hypothetical protein Ct9H300mP12_12860 [Acidimicrobiales bacterium]
MGRMSSPKRLLRERAVRHPDRPVKRLLSQGQRPRGKGSGWQPAEVTGSPAIPSCLASIDCMVREVVDAGDHWFVMGEVVAVSHVDEGSPLVFLGGKYGNYRAHD